MCEITLKTPCKKPIDTHVLKELECWQIECNDGQEIVTLNIEYVSHNEKFTGFISAEDVISDEIFMIPTSSISVIKKVKLISVKFCCSSEDETNEKTSIYICHYTIPHRDKYTFDNYGQIPISWNSFKE